PGQSVSLSWTHVRSADRLRTGEPDRHLSQPDGGPVNSPDKALEDFIARAKREKVTYASPGVGSSPHLAAELFKHLAKIDITHVPYRGVAAGAMNDLLAGRLDACSTPRAPSSSRCGRVRCGRWRSRRRVARRMRPIFRPSPSPACRVTRCNRGT